jgi:hypothetical protein
VAPSNVIAPASYQFLYYAQNSSMSAIACFRKLTLQSYFAAVAVSSIFSFSLALSFAGFSSSDFL